MLEHRGQIYSWRLVLNLVDSSSSTLPAADTHTHTHTTPWKSPSWQFSSMPGAGCVLAPSSDALCS